MNPVAALISMCISVQESLQIFGGKICTKPFTYFLVMTWFELCSPEAEDPTVSVPCHIWNSWQASVSGGYRTRENSLGSRRVSQYLVGLCRVAGQLSISHSNSWRTIWMLSWISLDSAQSYSGCSKLQRALLVRKLPRILVPSSTLTSGCFQFRSKRLPWNFPWSIRDG